MLSDRAQEPKRQLAAIFRALAKYYGMPVPTEPRNPFAAILWENVAYLVDDRRRAAAFANLERTIGLEPQALVAAGLRKLEAAIGDGGMRPAHRAAKLLRCAEIALQYAGGDLERALRALDAPHRRRLLERFPGIGAPGAAKVLLLAGLGDGSALDSNGLRVLGRIGLIAETASYAATYRAGVEWLGAAGYRAAKAVEAFLLLRLHGRELCKRSAPRCLECPIRTRCAYGRSHAGG